MNEIKLEGPAKGRAPRILLYVKNPADWPIAERLAGSMKNETPGIYQYALSSLNLNRIYSVFTGDKRPKLIGGSFFMDREREKMINHSKWAKEIEAIMQLERCPVEPNGKFIPYAHQTKIIGALQAHPFLGVFADCGLGKTGALARTAEILMSLGYVARGKLLVTGPLSILEPSWLDDVLEFTNLKAGILWSKIGNKDILGEAQVIHDYGPKPEDTVSVKKKSRVLFKNAETGQVLEELTELDKAGGQPWVKYKGNISYGYNLLGEGKPFGPVVGRTTVKATTKKDRVRAMLADPSYDLFLINHDGVKTYEEELKEHEFAWVAVDESTKIKNVRSAVSEAHNNISWGSKRRTILTGTPNPNGLIDLYSQFYFLDRGVTLESSIKDYLAEYFLPVVVGNPNGKGGIKWVLRSKDDQDRIIARVKRSAIFFKQRDCIDLPPRTDMRRNIRMTPDQERAYLEMENRLIAEYTDPRTRLNIRAEAVNVLAQVMKLRQITSGFLVGADGSKAVFDVNPKLEDLDGFIDELGDEKLVVACQFKEEIYTLLERYKDLGVRAIFGDEPVHKRTDSIRDFQNTDKIKIMILQPQAASHGITLTAACYLLFLSLDYNFEYYYQVAKRIERLGQKSSMFVIHSLAVLSDGSPTIDSDLMDVLAYKNQGRDALFEAGTQQPLSEVAEELIGRMIKRGESRV